MEKGEGTPARSTRNKVESSTTLDPEEAKNKEIEPPQEDSEADRSQIGTYDQEDEDGKEQNNDFLQKFQELTNQLKKQIMRKQQNNVLQKKRTI